MSSNHDEDSISHDVLPPYDKLMPTLDRLGERPYRLKHRDSLLEQIATGVSNLGDLRVHHVVVTFRVDDSNGAPNQYDSDGEVCLYEFGLADALKAIANDLYWDERGNWSEATTALVEAL